MIRKIGLLFAAFVILTSMTVPTVLACTTLTPGYWKNHPEAWPTEGTITVGAVIYNLATPSDKEALMAFLWAKPKGDAWIILAQKVIAAQLSMIKYPSPVNSWANPAHFGGYGGGMVQLVDDANALLAAHSQYRPGDPGRSDVTDLADFIDDYLNIWDEHGL